MCRSLKSVNLHGLTLTQTLQALQDALIDLQEITKDTDFNDSAHILQYKTNIKYIKTYYEQLELLLRYEPNK